MAGTAWELLLRLQSLLPSPVLRVCTIIRGCYDFYAPQTWLLLYYPLLYFAKVAKRLTILSAGRDNETHPGVKPASTQGQGLSWIAAKDGFAATTISVVILGTLLYVLLSRYSFLESDFWKGSQSSQSRLRKPIEIREDDTYSFALEVPDRLLQTSVEAGLSKDEVIARQKAYGLNEIRHERNWVFVLSQLSIGPANILLEAAAVIAMLFHDWWDLLVVCGLLALNIQGAIRKIRECDEVIRSIIGDVRARTTVLREGTVSQVCSTELVPGDIVHVSEGEIVTADSCVVTLDSALYIDQSNITGESDPVEKQLGNTCYAWTGVKRGHATLMVVGTGYQTFCGRTAYSIGDPMPERQPLGRVVIPRYVSEYQGVLRSIGVTVCASTLVPIAVRWIFGSPTRFSHQTLELAVGLAVVAVPASRDLYVSSCRSSGMARLMDDGGLVQGHLEGVECLAGIDILCCDKTGTITGNKLTLIEPYCISCDPGELILTACLSSSPDEQNLDPFKRTFGEALEQYPQARANLDQYRVLDHQPFDSNTKRMQSSVESPLGERMLCVSGAPKSVLVTYLQDHPDRVDIEKDYRDAATDFARRGYRSLGIARKRENNKWELLGMAPLFDPPRTDTASAVRVAKALGVSLKVWTGDAAAIAEASTQSIGMGMGIDVLDAESIDVEGKILTAEITARIEAADTYAEVDPVHKEKIVRNLQNRGHSVAATGDGLSDGPTLRNADCGIAVEGATEQAQFASDIVFTTPGLSTLVQAIQTSRQTFQQVHNYITYRTTLSLHMLFIMLWHYAAYSEVLDVRLLILNTHISDMVGFALGRDNDYANAPFSKDPARWSSRRLLAEVISLSVVLTTGSWLSVLAIPGQGATTSQYASLADWETISATRSQVLFLHIVLSDHWISLLTHTDSPFWTWNRNWRLLWTLLCADLLTTLLCVAGWVGGGHGLSPMVASWAWLVSFGTFGVAVGLRCTMSDGQLFDRPLS